MLKAHRIATNRRYYTQEDLLSILPQETGVSRRIVAYCRVSSVAQQPDLENQRKMIATFCEASNSVVDEWIVEIDGGLNFKRKQFLKLVDAMIAGEVTTLLIATRIGWHALDRAYWRIYAKPMMAVWWS